MSTLDGPIWSKCSITLTCPARSHYQRTQSKERWGQCWDERYRLSREGDEEGQEKDRRKQKQKTGADFEGAVCCPTAIDQGAT